MSVCSLYILEQWSSTKEDTHDGTPEAGITVEKLKIFIKTKNSQNLLLIADKVIRINNIADVRQR